MKAIKISSSNIDMLAARYGVETDDRSTRLPKGFYLVTDFGNEDTYDIVSEAVITAQFTVGQELNNGFVEINWA